MEPPTLGKEEKAIQNRYVYGIGQVGDSVKLLIDPEKLLKDEDLSLLEEMENELLEETTDEGEE